MVYEEISKVGKVEKNAGGTGILPESAKSDRKK